MAEIGGFVGLLKTSARTNGAWGSPSAMGRFDFVVLLLSFVFALAPAHVLSRVTLH